MARIDPTRWKAAPKPHRVWPIRKIVIGIFILITVAFGIYGIFLLQRHLQPLTLLPQPVQQVIFQTDGCLTATWARPYLSFKKGTDIMDVDIEAIQQVLTQCPQIKSVTVSRVFPDKIQVSITERKPVLRLLVQEGAVKKEMLIDAEGTVFAGICLSPWERRLMPFLAGTILTKEGKFYKKVPHLDKVCELLLLAKTKYWPIYGQMEVVMIENLKKHSVPWSRIKVRCQDASLVIFKDTDFDEQLQRLRFILSTPEVRKHVPVARIDLTYEKDAVVRFRK